jgi:hypothetical protein
MDWIILIIFAALMIVPPMLIPEPAVSPYEFGKR